MDNDDTQKDMIPILSGGDDGNSNDFLKLQAIINNAMAKQNQSLYKEITQLKDDQEKLKESFSIQSSEIDSWKSMEIARHRAEEHRFGFVSLNDLGQIYNVSIGSKTMGKLLRLVGLAKDKQSKTEPLRSSIMGNYAKSVMYGDFATYQWNPEKCIKKIDEWLMGKGIIDEFYSIEDEKKLTEYINQLYENNEN